MEKRSAKTHFPYRWTRSKLLIPIFAVSVAYAMRVPIPPTPAGTISRFEAMRITCSPPNSPRTFNGSRNWRALSVVP